MIILFLAMMMSFQVSHGVPLNHTSKAIELSSPVNGTKLDGLHIELHNMQRKLDDMLGIIRAKKDTTK